MQRLSLVFAAALAGSLDFRLVSTIVSALPAIPRATRLKFSGPRFCSKNPEKSWALILKRKTFQAHLRIAVAHFYSNDKGLCEGAMSTSSLLASFRVRCSSPSAVEAERAAEVKNVDFDGQ